MSSDFNKKLEDFELTVQHLGEIVLYKKDYSSLERDAAIKRFEMAYELAWKTLKMYANDQLIITSNSPKEILKNAILLGVIVDENTWLDIHQSRNLSVHTYNEALAAAIFADLPRFHTAFSQLIYILKQKSSTI